MTLQDARNLAASLDGKAPGHLIRAEDWNALASVLQDYGESLASLTNGLATLETNFAQLQEELAQTTAVLESRITALENLPAQVQQLEQETAPLRQNYLLKASTTRETHLTGEIADLVFTATTLDGKPLPDPKPWLDVVTTWGRLRAAPGFVVRENAEENALAVQFNSAGEVRLQLRSQFTKGISASTEKSMLNLMNTQAGTSGKTVSEALTSSSSAQDPAAQAAFLTISKTYSSSSVMREYFDVYLDQSTSGQIVDRLQQVGGEWKNYRATVIAFAKPDAIATSPDPTRGVASVQVNFREWVPGWGLGHLDLPTFELVDTWSGHISEHLSKVDLVPIVINELGKRGLGRLDQIREMKALEKAVNVINPGNDPLMQRGKAMLQGAVQMQLASGTLDTGMASAFGKQAMVTQEVGKIAIAAQGAAQKVANAENAIFALQHRIEAAEDSGKEISAGLRTLGDSINKIDVVQVADLGSRLQSINTQIAKLAGSFKP